jgi:hypothetical protein
LGILDTVRERDPLIDGESLVPILKGDVHHQVRTWLDLELNTEFRSDIHWNAIVGQYDNNSTATTTHYDCALWKYIFHVLLGKEQLFCLSSDPNEHHDLAEEETEVLHFWRETMVELFETQKRGRQWVKNGHLVAGRPSITFAANYPCEYEEEETTAASSVAAERCLVLYTFLAVLVVLHGDVL